MPAETRFLVGAMKCGCRVAVVVDDGTDLVELASDIRQMKRNGYTMTMESGPEYRADPVKMCVHKAALGLAMQQMAKLQRRPAR